MASPKKSKSAKATFAAGCFWGVEGIFMKVEGVISTQAGYTGGHAKNPAYPEVCAGTTGHAEAVRVEFDPKTISYKELLGIFFRLHDPTTKNRQGPDFGHQYRSAIFFHSAAQEKQARDFMAQLGLSGKFKGRIVTEIAPVSQFYPAEDYHQKYFQKHPLMAACHVLE